MKTFQLNAEPRLAIGKKATKNLRSEGKLPVVLNGGEVVELPYKGKLNEGEKVIELCNNKGVLVTDLVVKSDDIRKLIFTPEIYLIELSYNGGTKKAVLKDIQFDPITDAVLHLDLVEVYENKPVVIDVPVKLEGHAAGVKAGGKLNLTMKKVKVKALYNQIPEKVVVNVDNIALGQSLKISELHFEGLELMNSKNAVVCGVQLTRAARGAAAAANS